MIGANERARVIFGCGNFGGLGSSPSLRDKGDGRERALALLDHARDLGLTRFDTANTYGGGASETILGEWLSRQGSTFRSGTQIASKVGNPHGCPAGERPLSRTQIAHHLQESLRRLRVERIDLYYLHEFDASTPLDETLEAMDRAVAAGDIAALGVSNASIEDLRAVLALTGGALRRAFTTVQNEFNLLTTGDLDGVIPLARAEGISYAAFSPLAGGLLSGKYRPGEAPRTGRVSDAPALYGERLTDQTFAAIEGLRRRASEMGWSLPGAALRFILDRPEGLSLIIAPRSPEQFDAYGIGGSRQDQ
jgi:aryl-alcohol dehydrogenase-like predicted oxidoreductase